MLSVSDSYRYAGALTRKRARNFYYTFWFLPPERRRSIFAVYAFSRRADDAVDAVEEAGVSEPEARRTLDGLRALLEGSLRDDPLAPALRDTIERYRIPREPFEELLLGMEMDLVKKTYADFKELYQYCYRAASVVGLISMEIFGHTGANAREPAIKLGLAMQLTNIIRDVAEDQARGRCYLPQEDLERFGYTREDLGRHLVNQAFRDLMRFQVERARRYFEEASPLFRQVLPESRYCPVLLEKFYKRILEHVEKSGYDVLTRRPSLSLFEKLRLVAGVWREARRAGKSTVHG
jgi:phytoene synthase